jgi:hypothetical protein
MTAKEKAKELLNEFSMPIDGHKNIYYKKCALILINNILNEYKYYLSSAPTQDLGIDYWQKVEQEIEEL